MMGWLFAGIALSAALMATFVRHMRRAILALWVAGLGVGAMYLTVGAEFLAIIQWTVSTLVTISFIFFAVLFGEYNSVEESGGKNGILLSLFSIVLGLGFAAIIWVGARELPENPSMFSASETNLATLGRTLTQDHLLSLEVLALTLFLVLVGGGVIARFEGGDS
jgi:NADH:ubiquinone oxidoreductase subunit 6 (subunit J)